MITSTNGLGEILAIKLERQESQDLNGQFDL